MKKFCTERGANTLTYLAKDITTGDAKLTVNVTNAAAGDIYIEGVKMSEGLTGLTFFKSVPLTLKAVPNPGCTFKGWGGGATGSSDSLTITLSGDQTITAAFEGTAATAKPAMFRPEEMFGYTDRIATSRGVAVLTISFSSPVSDHARVTLLNLQGRKLSTLMESDLVPGSRQSFSIPMAYSPGIYLCRIHTNRYDRMEKISLR